MLQKDLALVAGGVKCGLGPIKAQHPFTLDEGAGSGGRRKLHMGIESTARQAIERGAARLNACMFAAFMKPATQGAMRGSFA